MLNVCFATLQLELLWGDSNLPSGGVVILPGQSSEARPVGLLVVLSLSVPAVT